MRRAGLALIPLALGLVGTIVALAAGDRRQIFIQWQLAWVWVQLGLLAALLVFAIVAVRAALRRRAVRSREDAVAAERAERRRFVDRLDHELKNPVTAIRLGLSNLPESDVAAGLDAQALRLTRLLGDLRKLGELENAQLEIAPVDVEALGREVAEAVGELAESSDRSLAVSFPRAPRPLPPVRGDADLLFLAVYNLVANALKFSQPGDRIELRGAEDDGWVTLEVADTGRGIPVEEQGLVWEELARGSHTRDVAGSGLGLPFVRTIVERHGGGVDLRSRLGEGTSVRLRLPV
ncbi:sensor histidine kinase KdpD [Schumannella sp. 10F1B-5-1]|uniref:sensor histidine kinase n=1 Tax=Schumannella sp. 10F1B-5-1 TaxID=2590780 RepID=UPI0011319DD3|nr:HAMP domain-containing sensor histidine kinase [Schumannella sp. 10F1B-5-1]TPW72982.1 HAMP domain-containing histidine kinase [Schumannella sp. 10F1B-5-1]